MSSHTFFARHRSKFLPISLLVGLGVFGVLFREPISAWFTGQALGSNRSPAVITQAGRLQLAVQLRPDPPRQRGNVLQVQVRDSSGTPVEQARVSVAYVMPAMGSMPEMRGEAEVAAEGRGRYRAAFDLPMGGAWTLEVKVVAATGTAEARYTLTVGSPGLRQVGGGSIMSGGQQTAHQHTGGNMEAQQHQRLQLAVQLRPDPPRQRGNVLQVQVQDASGTPVEQARVSVAYVMPAMGPMPEMRGEAEVAAEGRGRYRAAFDLPMGGAWTLEVKVVAATGTAEARYTLTVGSPGLRQVGGASPDGRQTTLEPGTIYVDAQRRQRIGVRTGRVMKRPMALTMRAVGRIAYDESRLIDVNLKFRGWIVKLYVNATGQYVGQGQPLFTFYSPELYAAQQEYLLALQSQTAARQTATPDRADYLVRAARQRLRLLDITEAQLGELERRGEPFEHMPILSPASGYVIEKQVVEGTGVEPGQRLYRLAALDRVWVEAEVYESDLPQIRVGQLAQVTLPYLPGRRYKGHVTQVYPYLQESTRTGRVRIELQNHAMELRPDMYANVELQANLGDMLLVPEEAIVYAGQHRLVFVDLGEGYLRPQGIEVGLKNDGYYEVLRGLREGDVVVTSGNFLVASESRIRSAVQQWGGSHATP